MTRPSWSHPRAPEEDGPVRTGGAHSGDVLRAGPDGVFRPEPLDEHTHWPAADDVRIGLTPPTDPAPVGAVHLDIAHGRAYRREPS